MKTGLRHYLALAAMEALFAVALAGCNGDAVTAETETNDPLAPPAFTEIAEAIPLDGLQSETIKTALSEWREASASQAGRQQRGADGKRGPGQDRGALMKAFVADVAPALDTTELAALVSFVVEHQESRMQAMRQEREGRRGMRDHRGGLLAELDLTEAQRAAMKEAREATRETMRSLHDQFRDGGITEEELRAQAQAAREAMKATVADILTEEQLAKFEELQAGRMTKRLEHRLENLGSHIDEKLGFLSAVLDLTGAQQSGIRTIMETAVEDEKAIIEAILAGDTTHNDGRTALHELRMAKREGTKAQLTDEQLGRLDAVKPLMRGRRHHK